MWNQNKESFFILVKILLQMISIQNGTCDQTINVLTMYAIIYKAAVLFLRQIDHRYDSDGLPGKLIAFIALIIDATDVCMQEKIFDAGDIVTQVN